MFLPSSSVRATPRLAAHRAGARRSLLPALAALALAGLAAARAGAQPVAPGAVTGVASVASGAAPRDSIVRVALSPGRSYPVSLAGAIGKVAVADPEIADVVVVSNRDLVINGKKAGETDVLLWAAGARRHYRVRVGAPADRQQVVLAVKIAEVRRDALRNVGVSARYRGTGAAQQRGGTGALATTAAGAGTPATDPGFLTLLTDFGRRDLLAFIEAEEQRGTARTLAEPSLMAGDRDSASFLAGGEIPIPVGAQQAQGGVPVVTIQFREFGVRLGFTPEILEDGLVKLHVRPEVSSLDYSNALVLSGIRVPALRTRRSESTVDVRRDESLVLSGLMNDERERVRRGVPGLMHLPVLGQLFSSTRWQRNESELVIVVTPRVIDPAALRPRDAIRLAPDTTLPARDALAPRLLPPAAPVLPPARP